MVSLPWYSVSSHHENTGNKNTPRRIETSVTVANYVISELCVQSYSVPVRRSDMSKQENSEKVWESLSSSAGETGLIVTHNLNSLLVGHLVQSLAKLPK